MNGTKKFLSVIIAIAVIGLGAYALSSNKDVDLAANIANSTDSTSSASNYYGDETSNTTGQPTGTASTSTISSTSTPPVATSSAPISSTNNNAKKMNTVQIETSKGTIVIETFNTDAPKTTANFIKLANEGFYNGIIFHRVIDGFMIQGGDPTGTGTGGPGYKFEDELNPNTPSAKTGYAKGTVAMANSGPNTNGSQFFIMLADYNQPGQTLPHNYTIFGKVVKGQDVVDAIGKVQVGAGDKPVTAVTMKKVTVIK